MNNSTISLERAFAPVDVRPVRVYPASQGNVASGDIFFALALKMVMLAFVYVFLRVYFNKPFFPFMWDQDLYYKDILGIINNPMVLLKGSSAYWSNNTLFSRMLGLLGLVFWGAPPFILAVSVNLIFSVIIAIYVVKIYYCFVEESYINPRLIFYVVLLSPVLNAYSCLILRDLVIVALFTMFIYYMLKNKFTGMITIALIFLAVRPLMGLFCALVYLFMKLTNWLLKFRLWWLYLTMFTAVILTFLMSMGVDRVRVALFFLERMEGNDITRLFGMGFLSGEEAGISGKTRLLIRFAAVDAILIPLLAYTALFSCWRNSDRDTRIFMAMTVAMHFTVGIVYLSTLKSFPARKLLMLIPVFYALTFYYFNIRKERKMAKLRAKLLYLSQFQK